MTVALAIREAAAALAEVSGTPRLDAELLMAHLLGLTRSELLLRAMHDPVPAGIARLVVRRLDGEPIAHIVGVQGFYGLELLVTPDVLIPRGDSETLVDAARAALAAAPPARVLDLGLGSGALLFAALSVWPQAAGVGIERSLAALSVAAASAGRLGLANRARLLRRDWSEPGWADDLGRFALILANPPYVGEGDSALGAEVRAREPSGALFAGPDGLDAYRVLIPQLPALLADGGVAVVEIGHTQAEAVTALAAAAGLSGALHRDLGGRPRALAFKKALGKAG